MKKTFIAMKLLVAVLAACAAPIGSRPQVAPTSQPAAPTRLAATAQPVRTAPAAAQGTAAYSDAPLESSVLLASRGAARGELHPVDPETGFDLRGYAPIDLDHHFSHAFSPDGKTIAIVTYPGSNDVGGTLKLIDLQAWRETATAVEFDNWISAMAFSPDGTRLVVAYAGKAAVPHGIPEAHHLAVVDIASQAIDAQIALDFTPRVLAYTPDGASLIAYGVTYATGTGLNDVRPPQAMRLDAVTLDVEWERELPGILDGQFEQEEPDGTKSYVGWSPALVLSADRQSLHIVHADEEKLTTIDFNSQSLRTVAIEPPRTWLDRLVALGAGVAHAKVTDGTTKRAVLSPDGTLLYVVGRTNDTFKDDKGYWQFEQTPLGLTVVDTATGAEITHLDTDADEVKISPDGKYLFLIRWASTARTDVVDAGSLEVVKGLAGRYLVPTRRLNGEPILLSSVAHSAGHTALAVLDLNSLDEMRVWSVSDPADWLVIP